MPKNLRGLVSLTSIVFLLFLTAALIGYSASLRGTQALLADREVSTGNTFTASTSFNNIRLELSPGTSKATYVTKPGPFPTIARFVNGELKLDFGEIRAGNCNNSSDVFRIKNLSNQPITVDFKLSDNLVPLFSWVQLKGGNGLGSGQEKRVRMKIDTAPNTSAGFYTGSLTVKASGDSFKYIIPLQVVVI